ncbi:MAG: mechanosensitive ion channel family protein, partial [Patescibacteria group bacterium]
MPTEITNFIKYLHSIQLGQNSAYDFSLALAILIGLWILLKIIQWIVVFKLKRLAKKTKTDFDDVIIEIFSKIKPPFYILISLYFGIQVLTLNDLAAKIIKFVFIIILIYEVVKAIGRFIDFLINKYFSKLTEEKSQNRALVNGVRIIAKIVLWSFALVLALSNLGINVTSLIAGLGIGGIAIALALQNVLSDIFSSFSIYLDKPFTIGDFIVVGKNNGTVEYIGLKSTRLRSPDGEQLIISNKELTDARIQNFELLKKRRILMTLGVTYSTPADKLNKIPEMIKQAVTQIDTAEFDRCHLKDFGSSSLDYELSYFVKSQDYGKAMDI